MVCVTTETQDPQKRVICQVIVLHSGDVVEGKVKGQGTVGYHRNQGETTIGAVTHTLQVTAIAGWFLFVWAELLTPDQGGEGQEGREVEVGVLPHPTGESFRNMRNNKK